MTDKIQQQQQMYIQQKKNPTKISSLYSFFLWCSTNENNKQTQKTDSIFSLVNLNL